MVGGIIPRSQRHEYENAYHAPERSCAPNEGGLSGSKSSSAATVLALGEESGSLLWWKR